MLVLSNHSHNTEVGDVSLYPGDHLLHPEVVCGVALPPTVPDGPRPPAGRPNHHVLEEVVKK